MGLQGDISVAMWEQRAEYAKLSDVPTEMVREEVQRIERKYREIYKQITDKYLAPPVPEHQGY